MSDLRAAARSDELLAAALSYAARGWCVLPLHDIATGVCSCREGASCETPGKHPRLRGWPEKASSDSGTLAGWWKHWQLANVGILTGVRSGILVLDVDPRAGGDESLAVLIAQHGSLPETLTVLTGGGGAHYYFTHPGGVVASVDVAPGLELKADGNVFVVAPPSATGEGPA